MNNNVENNTGLINFFYKLINKLYEFFIKNIPWTARSNDISGTLDSENQRILPLQSIAHSITPEEQSNQPSVFVLHNETPTTSNLNNPTQIASKRSQHQTTTTSHKRRPHKSHRRNIHHPVTQKSSVDPTSSLDKRNDELEKKSPVTIPENCDPQTSNAQSKTTRSKITAIKSTLFAAPLPNLDTLIKYSPNYLGDINRSTLFPKHTFWPVFLNFIKNELKETDVQSDPLLLLLKTDNQKKIVNTFDEVLSKEIKRLKILLAPTNNSSEKLDLDKKLLLCYQYLKECLDKKETHATTLWQLRTLPGKLGLIKFKILVHVHAREEKLADVAAMYDTKEDHLDFEVDQYTDFFHDLFMPKKIWKGQKLLLSVFAIPENQFDQAGKFTGQSDYIRGVEIFERVHKHAISKQTIGDATVSIDPAYRLMTWEYGSTNQYRANDHRHPLIDAVLLKPGQSMEDYLKNLICQINSPEDEERNALTFSK